MDKELRTNQPVDSDDGAREGSSFFRRSIVAMAMIAVFGYVVAFVQADRGTVHYNAYVSAYTDCFYHILDAGAPSVDCNFVPEVRASLILHREAFAVGEPFLNLALSLTVAIILSPLFRRFSRMMLEPLRVDGYIVDASADNTAHDPA